LYEFFEAISRWAIAPVSSNASRSTNNRGYRLSANGLFHPKTYTDVLRTEVEDEIRGCLIRMEISSLGNSKVASPSNSFSPLQYRKLAVFAVVFPVVELRRVVL
jgi:hypothetical protein